MYRLSIILGVMFALMLSACGNKEAEILAGQLKKAQTELDETREDLAKSKESLSQAEKDKLRLQNEMKKTETDLKAERDKIKKENDTFKSKVAGLEKDLNDAKRQIDKLKVELQEANAKQSSGGSTPPPEPAVSNPTRCAGSNSASNRVCRPKSRRLM
ncbi:MAG: hypothetical protein HY762_04580 [Planctomycetes bacterium]|nr:hypothetical protein [Planctomycetota bacterium]